MLRRLDGGMVALVWLLSACGVRGKSVVRQGPVRPPFAGEVINPDLQQYIVSEAAKLGGDGVIISCGAPGTVGERNCTGIALHTKATELP